MPGEASHFALVLERIARRALAQFRDISDDDLNRPLELPESNTACALATHLIGSAEYWVLQLASGRDVQRDRLSEFRATGTAASLIARYERWLSDMKEALDALPDEQMDTPAKVTASRYASLGGESITIRDALLHIGHTSGFNATFHGESMTIRDALLHAVEHCALHQGHLELTRQLLGYPPVGAQ